MPETTKSSKLFKIAIALLNAPKSREDVQEDNDIKKATFHNYINALKEVGFEVEFKDGRYAILQNSVSKVFALNQFQLTVSEKAQIKIAIDEMSCGADVKTALRRKLISGADDNYFIREFLSQEDQAKATIIIQAISSSKQVLFADYLSGNSGTCKSRRVEPFAFTPDFAMVWTYDVDSQAVRLFKVSRIREVVLFADHWQHRNRHIKLPTDHFRIVGTLDKPIALELNNRAYNLLIEEYPQSKQAITKLANGHFLLQTNVATYDGVGRFVLGLMDNITIVESQEFKQYIKEKLQNITSKFESLSSIDTSALHLQILPETTNL